MDIDLKLFIAGRSRAKTSFLGILLFLVVAWTFLPALGHHFINYDDPQHVTENTNVQSGLNLNSIVYAFHNSLVDHWHPITTLSHELDCQLFGLAPWGHHLVNVLIHAANAVLVFLLFLALTGALWRSFFIALFFGIHPLRVETAAWISDRTDLLAMLFLLVALLAYNDFANSPTRPFYKNRHYWMALGLFVMGLMSKPVLMIFPFLLAVLDCWPLGRWNHENAKERIMEKIPFLILGAGAGLVDFLIHHHNQTIGYSPLASRIENAAVACVSYLGKLFWPNNLIIPYPHPGQWPLVTFLMALTVLAALFTAVWKMRRHSYLLTGWLWFLLGLAPVIGLIQTGPQFMADRYTYIPDIGILLIAAWGLEELTRRWTSRALPLFLITTGLALAAIVQTRQQLAYWRDTQALFHHSVEVTPRNTTALILIGNDLNDSGKLAEAGQYYQKAIAINPDSSEAFDNYAVLLHKLNREEEAEHYYQRALKDSPNNQHILKNYARLLYKQQRMNEAAACLEKALSVDDYNAQNHIDLGSILMSQDRIDESMQHFLAAMKYDPNNLQGPANMAIALNKSGRNSESIRLLEATLDKHPDAPVIHALLGESFYNINNTALALQHFLASLEADPAQARPIS